MASDYNKEMPKHAAFTQFPYVSTPESLSATHQVRAEGRIHEMSLGEKIGYARKYLCDHKTSGPIEALPHFQAQHAYLQKLAVQERASQERPGQEQPTTGRTTARLGFVGDLMWLRDSWRTFLPEPTLTELRKLDGIVGNLETAISRRHRVPRYWPDQFFFNSDPGLVESFSRSDGSSLFAALSFANNHTLDYGDAGAVATLEFLAEKGIPKTGLRLSPHEKTWTRFTRHGLSFGVYAATFGLNVMDQPTQLHLNRVPGLAPEREDSEPDLTQIEAALREMGAAGIDTKIIFLHWGFEFESYPSPKQMLTARRIAALGADVLVGSHAHVTQPWEVLSVNGGAPELSPTCQLDAPGPARKTLVLYSLGNFASAMFTKPCRLAPLAELSFSRAEDGRVHWHSPGLKYFYNDPASPGGRKLRPLEEMNVTFPPSLYAGMWRAPIAGPRALP